MQRRFFEARHEARAKFIVALGQARAMQRPLLGVGRIGKQERIDVLGVVGVELSLDDGEWRRSHMVYSL